MFSYNPGVYDQSGQILADSITQTAATQAQMYNDLGKNIGSGVKKAASAAIGFATGGPAGAAMAMKGANEEGGSFLDTIVSSYAKKEQDKSDSKIYGNLMKIVAPAFGKEGDGILQTYNELETDAERAEFGRTIAGSLGVIGNMYAQTGRLGLQQQGQQIQQNAPYVAADIKNRQNIAGGNVPHGGGGGMAPVEPPLPPYSPAAASQPPAPSAALAPSIPGGQASIDAINRDRQRRGLAPIK
jgi:hypothetical protein